MSDLWHATHIMLLMDRTLDASQAMVSCSVFVFLCGLILIISEKYIIIIIIIVDNNNDNNYYYYK